MEAYRARFDSDPEIFAEAVYDGVYLWALAAQQAGSVAGGVFEKEDAGHLGASVCRETLARAGVDPAELDEVIVGCVGQPHDQANVGRVVALRAGVPQKVPARTVARNCASGMEAVTTASRSSSPRS